jgi:DNA-binding NtrC family response regulator
MQGDTVPPLSKTPKSRFPWKAFFQRSPSAVFVLGANRRLRYANPAWEKLTGKSFAALRGTRISTKRESASPLWKALAPPLEVWNGASMQVRRARPEVEYGPPWWDISFAPLAQPHGNAVIGFLTQVGETLEKHAFREPAALATARAEHAKQYTLELFAGDSPGMERLRNLLRTASIVQASVWIYGGAGTGKETAARVIHHLGPNREKALVALDCKALQPYLIENLCFGRGGFATSGAVGTLSMKSPEILPRDLQTRFVEWSESKNAPRFICCSNGTPQSFIEGESLVPGFLAKLAALFIEIPPLRERLDELPLIVERVVVGTCDESIWPALRAHPWPKNIHELRASMNESAKNAAGAPIKDEHLPQFIRDSKSIADSPPVKLKPLAEVMENFERRVIETALGLSGGKPTVAAERLGMTRAKLLKRMKALGFEQ